MIWQWCSLTIVIENRGRWIFLRASLKMERLSLTKPGARLALNTQTWETQKNRVAVMCVRQWEELCARLQEKDRYAEPLILRRKKTNFQASLSMIYGGPPVSHQNQMLTANYKSLTANSNRPQQIQIVHSKLKSLTANSNCSQQITNY